MSVASLGPARTISCRQAPLSSLSSPLPADEASDARSTRVARPEG